MIEELKTQVTAEGRLFELEKGENRALLVGVYHDKKKKEQCDENLLELERLGDTYGLQTIEIIAAPLRRYDPSTYIGKGKVEEIHQIIQNKAISVIVFDDEIAPHQQRNLEKIFQAAVIDRTELILGVFAQHAQTKEAKIQVQLAQYRYQLPRLKRMWTHLERQRIGGAKGGYLKGAGERQIEIDRRLVRDKLAKLQADLEQVKKQRELRRTVRKKSRIPTFAIIGYTNVGKSTLLNALTGAGVLVEDQLFATLDTTTRKFFLPNNQEILLIDTVGFIRKIPHLLVAAFKSTLEEALQADILLHLIDVSHRRAEEQAEATHEVLKELKVETKPMITCLNKVDICHEKELLFRLKLKYPKTVEISALKRQGFKDLMEMMIQEIALLRKFLKLRIPQSHYRLVSELMKEGEILFLDYEGNDILLETRVPASLEKKCLPFVIR